MVSFPRKASIVSPALKGESNVGAELGLVTVILIEKSAESPRSFTSFNVIAKLSMPASEAAFDYGSDQTRAYCAGAASYHKNSLKFDPIVALTGSVAML